MTITYPDGAVLDALVLSQSEDSIRAVVAGEEEVRTLTRVHGTWVSEDCEPVVVEFAWQRQRSQVNPTEADCICSKALAARLIAMLWGAQDDSVGDTVHVIAGDGNRMGVNLSQPGIH